MLCRLCVNECSDFTDIFEGEDMQNNISNSISTYFTFNVSQDDEYSTIVCRNCLDNLNNFNSFCKSVENAQEKWQLIVELNVKDEEDQLNEELNNIEQSDSDHDSDDVPIKDEYDELDSTQNYKDEKNSDNDSPIIDQKKKSKKSRLSEDINLLIASNTNLLCNECSKPMENFKMLKKHFKEDHKKAGYMICCKRKFFRAADLADHINIHLNPEYFKCWQCDKSFSSRYSLDFHMKTVHVNKTGERSFFKCKYCSRKYLTESALKKHRHSHCEANSDANKHFCAECGKGYASESKLKAHHFNVHTMVYSRMCHLCGKAVRGNKALEQHQLEHEGIKQKVSCEICGAELSTKGILKAHMIALHPEDSSEKHVCTVCGKNAPSKRALKYHMDYVHNCERSHKCNLCEKSFKRLHALKEHITTHTGDRLYECPHCPKTFKVRSNMHHHRKLKHPKEFEETRRNRTKSR